jgi:hypothetical protein
LQGFNFAGLQVCRASSLQGFKFAGLSGRAAHVGRPLPARSLDKSKFSLFKPSSLDVIFHECKITVTSQGKLRCFCGKTSTKVSALIF